MNFYLKLNLFFQLGLDDGDEIDAMVEQHGGGAFGF